MPSISMFGVEVLADHGEGVLELDQPAHRQILALHGDDHLVGRRQGVDREQSEARRRVDADEVVVVHRSAPGPSRSERSRPICVDIAISAPARSIDEQAMSISRLRMTSRIEVWWTSTSYIDFSTRVGVDALRHRQVALRVHVDAEDAVALLREGDSEVQGGGGLGHAALLVGEGDDLGRGPAHGEAPMRVGETHWLPVIRNHRGYSFRADTPACRLRWPRPARQAAGLRHRQGRRRASRPSPPRSGSRPRGAGGARSSPRSPARTASRGAFARRGQPLRRGARSPTACATISIDPQHALEEYLRMQIRVARDGRPAARAAACSSTSPRRRRACASW